MKAYLKPQICSEELVADSSIASSGPKLDGKCCYFYVVESFDADGVSKIWEIPGTDDKYMCTGFNGGSVCS